MAGPICKAYTHRMSLHQQRMSNGPFVLGVGGGRAWAGLEKNGAGWMCRARTR